MKAIVCTRYGPPGSVRLKEIEKPDPDEGQVLIKNYATCVNFNALVFLTGKPFFARAKIGLFKSKVRVPGSDFAGRVEAVGKNAARFRPGDVVIGETDSCGYGAFAEYVCAPESALVPKPGNVSFAEAAASPQAGLVAQQALRDMGRLREEQSVLVCGASGGIGTFAIQIAKALGAEVTGVCSGRNLAIVRAIGADRVIDYTQEDFAKDSARYDLIVATAGYRPIRVYERALKPGGIYVATGGTMKGRHAMRQVFEAVALGPRLSKETGKELGMLSLTVKQEDLVCLIDLIESGKVRPVIDRCYAFDKTSSALEYYALGHSSGKVVITVANGG